MKFVFWNALTAGAAGTIALTLVIRGSRLLGLTRMPRFRDVVGSTIAEDRDAIRVLGRVGHFTFGTVAVGPIYGMVFDRVDSASWTVGLVAGLVHGVVAELVFLPLLSRLHPTMSGRRSGTPAEDPDGPAADVVPAPGGPLGLRWGALTPLIILLGHAAYGIAAALMYDWITPLRRF